ncbi:MAG: hypothetical protein E3J86_01465 [Candidatus Thorarchaeota archaeon]|nr:MAG: hypothetical protein E3J86_01465 [Candidatus Thorarchaeota archaeon]
MTHVFDELRKQYKQPYYNGTVPVTLVELRAGGALLRVERVSMATRVDIHEAPLSRTGQSLDPNVIESLDRSISENSAIWQELSRR